MFIMIWMSEDVVVELFHWRCLFLVVEGVALVDELCLLQGSATTHPLHSRDLNPSEGNWQQASS